MYGLVIKLINKLVLQITMTASTAVLMSDEWMVKQALVQLSPMSGTGPEWSAVAKNFVCVPDIFCKTRLDKMKREERKVKKNVYEFDEEACDWCDSGENTKTERDKICCGDI